MRGGYPVARQSLEAVEIVIPTGRTGFCCIVPCALLAALYALAASAILLAVRLIRARHRAARR